MKFKQRGYIYIFTIILVGLLSLFFYFIYSYISNSSYINLNRVDRIKANYAAESVLNIKISEDSFEKELRDFIFSEDTYKNLSCEIKPLDTEIIKLFLRKVKLNKDSDINDIVELNAKIKYKKISTDAKIRGNYINKIYKEKDGVLNSGKVNKEDLEKIRNSFKNNDWTKNNKVIELDGDYIFGTKNGNYFIFEEIREYDDELKDFVVRRNILYKVDKTDVIIQNSGTLKMESECQNQILIINDKVLFNDNQLSGIIVLNENAEISNHCKLDGYLIDLYDRNSGIDTKYNNYVLEKYGYVLPDFIKFQPISLNYNN